MQKNIKAAIKTKTKPLIVHLYLYGIKQLKFMRATLFVLAKFPYIKARLKSIIDEYISSQQLEQISVEAGDTRIFRFTLPMALNEGHYLVSFGVSSGDPLGELVPLDRRYDSVMVNVTRTLPFWGIVDLSAQFKCLHTDSEAVTA